MHYCVLHISMMKPSALQFKADKIVTGYGWKKEEALIKYMLSQATLGPPIQMKKVALFKASAIEAVAVVPGSIVLPPTAHAQYRGCSHTRPQPALLPRLAPQHSQVDRFVQNWGFGR